MKGYKALVGGDFSKLVGGYSSELVGGDFSELVGGNSSKLAGGEHSIMVGDHNSMARGKKGALIVIIEREWRHGEYIIKAHKATIVDGVNIKEDTPYRLVNGELIEVIEEGV